MINLLDYTYEEIKALVVENGFPSFRAQQIMELINSYKNWDESTSLPKNLIEKFKDYTVNPISIKKEVKGKRGVKKYLYTMQDRHLVEGVFLPNNYGNTLCVSTQIGCKMGCVFCASGKDGFMRDLSAGEILAQVLLINKLEGGSSKARAISNVVLMGSGEPLDNYDNVVKFLKNISSPKGLGMSLRNITISTCGLIDEIEKLSKEGLGVTLTISLHAADDETRAKIMPIAKTNKIDRLIEAVDKYFKATGRRVSYEYALTQEASDEQSIKNLIKLLKGKNSHVNLIRLNKISGQNVSAITEKRSIEILNQLNENGISATLRRSLGSEIEGACGQLKNHFLEDKKINDPNNLANFN